MGYEYYFTIFIPAYNRANTLPRLFDSLDGQTFKNFEIIIIDDGSTDNTKKIVDNYIKNTNYDIRYFYQENQGKPSARNCAVDLAKGKLFKTIDSDDIVTDDCLELMRSSWEEIPKSDRENYAGIIGLTADYNTGEVIGDMFPQDIFDSNHIKNATIYKIKGDKTQCIRTELMKENKFPIINKDKFIAETIVWNRIGLNYKFRYINKILKLVEYQNDGMTNNLLRIRTENWRSSTFYYKEYSDLIVGQNNIPFTYKFKGYINYIRFSLHGGRTLLDQIKDIDSKFTYSLALIFGLMMWKRDELILKKGSNIND